MPFAVSTTHQEASLFRDVSLARGMNLQGSVRVEAVVAPDGSAKTVKIKGGHPLLAQAAHDAIQKWKWAPASNETRELIEVKFIPYRDRD